MQKLINNAVCMLWCECSKWVICRLDVMIWCTVGWSFLPCDWCIQIILILTPFYLKILQGTKKCQFLKRVAFQSVLFKAVPSQQFFYSYCIFDFSFVYLKQNFKVTRTTWFLEWKSKDNKKYCFQTAKKMKMHLFH